MERAMASLPSHAEPGSEQRKVGHSLSHKLSQREARVGVVGLGYVGLPTMVAIADAGFQGTGIEIKGPPGGRINAGQR